MIQCGQLAGKAEELTKPMAYLLGTYLTDGCIYTNGDGWKQFRLLVIDQDFAEHTRDAIEALGYKATVYSTSRRNRQMWDCYTGAQDLTYWLELTTAHKHHVPMMLHHAEDHIKLEFLTGVMDGDGYICKYKDKPQYIMGLGATGAWMPQVRWMMKRVGVKVGKLSLEDKGRNIPLFRFTINKESAVRAGLLFSCERKRARLHAYIQHAHPELLPLLRD